MRPVFLLWECILYVKEKVAQYVVFYLNGGFQGYLSAIAKMLETGY